MKILNWIQFRAVVWTLVIIAALSAPQVLRAERNWKAAVGGQNTDKAHQALAFLPNELWIHTGDSITWTQNADDIHTVTFLTSKQIFPSFQVGCPGFTFPLATFDGSTCVSTPPLAKGQTFTVHFPKAGNYKVVCLMHNTMNGTIHVLNTSAVLPHDQDFYDVKGAEERQALLTDTDRHMKMEADPDHDDDDDTVRVIHGNKHVTAGAGEISATPGGLKTASLVRFLKGTVHIEAGDTVEWSSHDPEEPHTITFGTETRQSVSAFVKRNGGQRWSASRHPHFAQRQRAFRIHRSHAGGRSRPAAPESAGFYALPRHLQAAGHLQI